MKYLINLIRHLIQNNLQWEYWMNISNQDQLKYRKKHVFLNLCTYLIIMLTLFQNPAVKSPLVLQNLMNSVTWSWPRLISFLVFSNMSLVFSMYRFASWRKQDEPIPLKIAQSMSILIFEYLFSESFLFSIMEVFCEYGRIIKLSKSLKN